MKTRARLDLVLAALFVGIVGIYDIAYVVFSLARGPRIGPYINVLFPDFLVFYAAVQAFFEGKLSIVYDIAAITQYQNDLFFPERFSTLVTFRPFFYPPIWLLMALPLALLAVTKAYVAFMSFTVAAATAVEGRRTPWGWLAVLTCPAAAWVIVAGQNTFLSVALFYGGFRLLDRSPAWAGVLLGCLSYKPQIWVLVPLALFAARKWRALAWTVGTVAALSLLSLLVFGLDTWLAFFAAIHEMSSPKIADEIFNRVFMQMTTLLASARLVGLSPATASALQAAGALLAIAATWRAFRCYESSSAQIAVLAVATFLVSPYTLNYDLLLLMPAAVALFGQAIQQRFLPLERLVYLFLWLIPTAMWVLNQLRGTIAPLIVLAFGLVAWQRLTTVPIESQNLVRHQGTG